MRLASIRRMRPVIALVVSLAFASTAAAEPDEPVERYGLVVAGVDVASLALMAATRREEAGVAAIFGGPIVHYAYGNHLGSWWSLGARTTLPVAGGMAAILVDDCAGDLGECDERVIFGGVLVGLGAAMVLDWTVLAKRPKDAPVIPIARANRGGFELGLAGAF